MRCRWLRCDERSMVVLVVRMQVLAAVASAAAGRAGGRQRQRLRRICVDGGACMARGRQRTMSDGVVWCTAYQEDTLRSPEVRGGDGTEALLPRRVPDLELDTLPV